MEDIWKVWKERRVALQWNTAYCGMIPGNDETDWTIKQRAKQMQLNYSINFCEKKTLTRASNGP